MGNLVFKANDELEYRIRFEHLTPNQIDKHDSEKRKPHSVCFIQQRKAGDEEWQTLSEAMVRLHNGDNWNRALGRQYAFEKVMCGVLHNSELDRPIRTELWKRFWTTCKSNAKLKKVEVGNVV